LHQHDGGKRFRDRTDSIDRIAVRQTAAFMSAKPTLRVHDSCEFAITPTVILPMLSFANSAATSESTAPIPLTARAGNVWQVALCTRTVPQASDINTAFAAA
jgi:hypothetical protein